MVIGTNSIVYMVGLLWSLSAAAAATEPAAQPSGGNLLEKLAQMEFPQIAEVTGTDVNIRSGPGTSYYRCGKLNPGDKVTVVDILHNTWAKIVPPEGSYSWISKTYVQLNPNNPKVGVLTGDDVRVWAGSDFVEPLHSHSQQTKLYKGDIVELVGPADLDADYYKIKPPADAYLWVSMDYLKLLGPVSALKPAQPTPAAPQAPAAPQPSPAAVTPPTVPPSAPAAPAAEQPAAPAAEAAQPQPTPPAPAAPSADSLALQRCSQLRTEIEEQLKKPLPEQDYRAIKDELNKILQSPDVDRAKIYAESLLKQVASYELAVEVHRQLQLQDKMLEETRAKIAAAHQAQLQQAIPAEAKYLFVGVLKPSYIYTGRVGPRRFVIMDQNTRILCYLMTRDPAQQSKMEVLTDKIVGVRGTILDAPNALIPVVMVDEVVGIFEQQ
ncbi:MAG: SH3 domain-containing protein [Anaerohalosphaeraceae bacterium]